MLNHRPIRSYAIRGRRITIAQQRALYQLWERYVIDLGHPSNQILDFDEIFNRSAPLAVEIGSGNGEMITTMASQFPQTNFVAIEVYKPGIGCMLNNANQLGLNNLRVICSDAIPTIKKYFSNDSIDQVMIMFPDPWQKKRHHKRRIIRNEFVTSLADKMKPESYLYLATDWLHYAATMRKVIEETKCYKRCDLSKLQRPKTNFELRAIKEGRYIFDITYQAL